MKKIFLLSTLALLTACGAGGGGGSSTSNAPALTTIPLQTAFKNIFNISSSASGQITGTKNVISNSCNGGNGGSCNLPVTGSFTKTTTVNGLNVNVNYAQTFDGQGINTSYTGTFANNYATMILDGCSLTLPITASVGYTQVATCPSGVNITLTANTSNEARLVINGLNAILEAYDVTANGSITPIISRRAGTLIPAFSLVTYNLNLNF